MSWSLGETRSLAVRAARGADMAWGLAEETGFAVRWLQAHGAPGLQALAAYLRSRDEATGRPGGACPIELGCRLLDAGLDRPNDLGPVCQPLLLTPFIAAATLAGTACLAWEDVELLVSSQGLGIAAPWEEVMIEQATCRLTICSKSLPMGPSCQRVPESEGQSIALLGTFAARTYAPSSDQSRLAGAGAGINDND